MARVQVGSNRVIAISKTKKFTEASRNYRSFPWTWRFWTKNKKSPFSPVHGRFPFNQKFRGFRVGRRMEQNFPGIKFRNFRTTSRGSPKIPENRNNRKIKGKFRSIRPFRLGPSFSEPYWRVKMASSMSPQYQCTECLFSSENLQVLVQHNCLGNLAGMAGVMSGK